MEKYQRFELFGIPALFTDGDPQEFADAVESGHGFMYVMRHGDDDSVPLTVEPSVIVNRYGSVFAATPILSAGEDMRNLPIDEWGFCSDLPDCTIAEFLDDVCIELGRNTVRVDPSLEISEEWVPSCVVAYLETWFDVDRKFGTHTNDREDAWINLYAMYSPENKTVDLEYYVETDTSLDGPHKYKPSESERHAIMEMIEEKCRAVEKCSCMELLQKSRQ